MTAAPFRGTLAILLAAPGLLAGAPGSRPGARMPLAPMVVAQVPVAGGMPAALGGGTLPAGFGEGGRLVLVSPSGKPRVLTASFHSAADPEVSFDGKSILFAGKKAASDPWCVFEMKADGSAPRQITCGKAGARQPVYQSTVYTITPTNVEPWVQVAFVGENPGERNEAGVAPNTSLWSCKTDGTALRRLTFNLSNDRDPVDPAGRPDGVRGLAAVAGTGAGGPRGASRRQRGRHRLPDLRGGPGPSREADARPDRERPRGVRRGGPHRG